MSDSTVCCGACFVGPEWFQSTWKPMNPLEPTCIPLIYPGLTTEEQLVLKHLADAFTVFVSLAYKHPDDDTEFRRAIHEAQRALAIRVARRIDPHIWAQPQSPT